MVLSCAVSEINGDFNRKSQNFHTPCILCPLGITYQRSGSKTRMTELPGRERSSTISPAAWIQSSNVADRQTDGQSDTGQQQIPRLRIASRGKNQGSRVKMAVKTVCVVLHYHTALRRGLRFRLAHVCLFKRVEVKSNHIIFIEFWQP